MAPSRRKSSQDRKEKADVPNKKAKVGHPGISVLFKQYLDGSGRDEQNQDQSSILFDIVWPFLKNRKEKRGIEWDQACQLLVFLVTNQEGKPSAAFCDDADLLRAVLTTLLMDDKQEKAEVIHFCIILLVSDVTRKVVIEMNLGPQLLHFVPERRQELELKRSAAIRRSFSLAGPDKPERLWTVDWLNSLLFHLKETELDKVQDVRNDVLTYIHRSFELLIDFLSAFDSRQFLVLYLESIHFSVQCQLAIKTLPKQSHRLLQNLLSRVFRLIDFPVRSVDKTPLTKTQVVAGYHSQATLFQRLCHCHYPEELPEVIFAGVGLLCNGNYLSRVMAGLPDDKLFDLLFRLRLLEKNSYSENRDYMMAILMHHLTVPPYPLDQLKSYPLYPTEQVLFDHNVIPPGTVIHRTPVLSIPKLHTQFLSYQDYLLRNFELVRLESAYDIRSDLVDAIKRVRPVVRQYMKEESNELVLKTEFTGWARMALELEEPLRIMRVAPPKLGEGVPAQVVAELTVDLVHCGDAIRKEWDDLGEYDNLFLIAIDANRMTGAPPTLLRDLEAQLGIDKPTDSDRRVPDDEDSAFPERFGVTCIRGCMILNIRDDNGNIVSDPFLNDSRPIGTRGTKRIMRVELDAAQYTFDSLTRQGTATYQTLNLVVRRRGRENNFKAVLETIRGLMEGSGSVTRAVPSWLQPVLLGYGDPKNASYSSSVIKSYAAKTPGVAKPDAPLDFGDTFLNEKHLADCFPDRNLHLEGTDSEPGSRHNIRLIFKEDSIVVSKYPFSIDIRGNSVRFTPVQVEAIKSGLCLGLTCIVGPPGTGKSDVAVQIIVSLYHSFPSQRTVIITHSNAALNDLFQKIMARGDIEERYMIRLGAGERDLEIDSSCDFSRVGRVSHSLARRSELLEQVQQLSEALGISGKAERGADGSPSYTCESAGYFYKHYVKPKMVRFHRDVAESDEGDIGEFFPFSAFYGMSNKELANLSLSGAETRFRAIDRMFSELEEYRPLELLRSQRQRTDYFLTKQAKIVAMTCTHAAIARSRLIEMGFHYDNLVMEEAGQMTEVETFIPLLLQRGEADTDVSRLKRICMIGDHNQLPPIVKNITFARFSNLDQSLFARLIGFGVPYIQLNRQGRTRPEIADLFRWRYGDLGDLQHVVESPEYKVANAGFANTYILINVEDYNGKGETTPTAYFYQNVGEAEYAVALFQFMVLIGYPAAKISILATYNGQKELITDILAQRCGKDTPFAGMSPKTVSTVDQYQGQQNDYIILSLVRTVSVGYLRDVRRFVVALSRARLGLYILCRQSLFDSCHELKPAMKLLSTDGKLSNKLQIVLGEHYPTTRGVECDIRKEQLFEIADVSHLGSIVHSMQEEWIQES